MSMSDVWQRRLEMRKDGLSNAEIASAEGVAKRAIEVGFARLHAAGVDFPLHRCRTIPPGTTRAQVWLAPATQQQITALAAEFGMSRTQVLTEVIAGAVLDFPDTARNLLDPEA